MKRALVWLLLPFAWLDKAAVSRLLRLWRHVQLKSRIRYLAPTVVVNGWVEVNGTGNIDIKDRVHISPHVFLETQGIGQIHIDSGCVFSRGVHLASRYGIEIGEGTMVGEYASIRDANHRFGPGLVIRDSGYEGKPIVIGRQVWIGRGATVLPGVVIGDHAVIGAGAVVTRDVPAGAVALGIPAVCRPEEP